MDTDTKKFYSLKKMKPILGNSAFVKKISDKFFKSDISKEIAGREQIISSKYPSLEEILLLIMKKYKINAEEILQNKARNYIFERSLLIYLFVQNPRYKMVEKAAFIGISSDGIYRNNKRFLYKLNRDIDLKEKIRKIEKEILNR